MQISYHVNTQIYLNITNRLNVSHITIVFLSSRVFVL